MESNLRTLGSYTLLKQILTASYNYTKIPVLVHGAPGIGKSQVLKQVADELGIGFLPLMLSQFPSEDVAGLPVPRKKDDGGFITIRSLPDFLPTSGKGILFFDEINQAQPSVLNAIFQLILDRKLAGNSYTLPEGWVVFAACNDVEHNQNITEFEPPWNDRFLHINFKPTSDEWLKYAKEKFNNKTYAFLKSYKETIFASEREMNEKIVFQTPRSWERVSNLENSYDAGNITDEMLLWMVSGLVGSPLGLMYMEETMKYRLKNGNAEQQVKTYEESIPRALVENFSDYMDEFRKLQSYQRHSAISDCLDYAFKVKLFSFSTDNNDVNNLLKRILIMCSVGSYPPEYLMKKIASHQRKTVGFDFKKFISNLCESTKDIDCSFENVYPEIAKLGK